MGRGPERTLQTGDRAPAVSLRTLDGAAVSLPDLWAAGPVLLAFYKASCPTCQLTLPFLERLRRQGARVFCAAQDDAAIARAFNAEYGLPDMPTLIDPAADGYPASNAFAITHVPSMFLIGADGVIEWDSIGFYRIDLEQLGRRFGAAVFRDGDNVPAMKAG